MKYFLSTKTHVYKREVVEEPNKEGVVRAKVFPSVEEITDLIAVEVYSEKGDYYEAVCSELDFQIAWNNLGGIWESDYPQREILLNELSLVGKISNDTYGMDAIQISKYVQVALIVLGKTKKEITQDLINFFGEDLEIELITEHGLGDLYSRNTTSNLFGIYNMFSEIGLSEKVDTLESMLETLRFDFRDDLEDLEKKLTYYEMGQRTYWREGKSQVLVQGAELISKKYNLLKEIKTNKWK